MDGVLSSLLVLGAVAAVFFVLRRQDNRQHNEYGPSGMSEFRTDLALDECMDRLSTPAETDEFAYTIRRETDGGWTLHFTMPQPTSQPLDTLYTLRLDPGKQTVATLIFRREAFGYAEPVFQPALLDKFMEQKLQAVRTK